MKFEFELTHLIHQMPEELRLDIFHTSDIVAILNNDLDKIETAINTAYDNYKTSDLKYGDIIRINNQLPAIYIGIHVDNNGKEDANYIDVLTHQRLTVIPRYTAKVTHRHLCKVTHRHLWLEELQMCAEDDGIPITTTSNKNDIIGKLKELMAD